MSDLLGGDHGSGRPSAGAGVQQPVTPAQASSTAASAIRTPRQILAGRTARIEQKNADAAEAQRKLDLERRRSAERRAAAAGITAPRDSGYRTAGPTPGSTQGPLPGAGGQSARISGGAVPQATPTRQQAASSIPQSRAPTTSAYVPPAPQQSASQARISQAAVSQQQSQQQQPQQRQPPPQQQQQPQPQAPPSGSAYNQAQGAAQYDTQTQTQTKSLTFPHAFERWEMLSAQWEGVTSHWIRVLEIHAQELQGTNERPTVEHMGRYITDLSAAGANLFHAVVELQRLRASSERKFQRWFFETRDQQQANVEELARLRADLDDTRRSAAAATAASAAATAATAVPADFEKQRAELKREMQIAKEEARRAWEELGKREEMERDQQYALRDGLPVFIGGVQVLPSTVVQRGASLRQPEAAREVYTTQGPPASGQEYVLQPDQPSPTDTDPFTETARAQGTRPNYRPIPTGMPAYQPAAPQVPTSTQMSQQPALVATTTTSTVPAPAFYQQSDSRLQGLSSPPPAQQFPIAPRAPGATRSGGAFSASSEEETGHEIDEHGNIRRDAAGRPIPFRPRASPVVTSGATRGAIPIGLAEAGLLPPPVPPPTVRRVRDEDRLSSPSVASESEDDDDDDDYVVQQPGRPGEPERYLQVISRPPPADPSAPDAYRIPDSEIYHDYEREEREALEAARLHQHPTRLSDVMEEDERSTRSRTSPTR